jgi:hypothetical protein
VFNVLLSVPGVSQLSITAPEKYARDSVEVRTVEFVKDFRAITSAHESEMWSSTVRDDHRSSLRLRLNQSSL